MLPKLFIGSSKEAQEAGLLDTLLTALKAGLNSTTVSIELVPWPSSPWRNLTAAVQTLVENLVDYSYGVFILSADDELSLRGSDHYAARDNVIFEFGLFLAYLGPERTFLVGPSGTEKTIAMSAVKPMVPHTSAPLELPLRILTDLGSAYRKGSYTIVNPGTSPTITFHIADVIAAIQDVEANTSGLTPPAATTELAERLLRTKAEISKSGKGDAYYTGQFFSRFRDIGTLKAKASLKSVQHIVQDLLLYLERVRDLVDISQLAHEQHHSQGIKEVWVFADKPLEFRAGLDPEQAYQAFRNTISENLRNGVRYVYFVGPDFNKSDVDHLVDPSDSDRAKMLKCIHVVKVNSQFFSTYFTLHFKKKHGKELKAIYMSSVRQDLKDVLIQVSDKDHMQRIYDRIRVLYGVEENKESPKITRHVL